MREAALTFGIALAAGMIAQVLARHLRMPGIVLLLLVGVLLGPDVANIVRPDTLGPALRMITSAAVAVILFEGGMHLDMARLRTEGPTIRRLVTIGALVTGAGGTLLGHYVMEWPWQVAVPFGTLVTVTGPTVIGPLLRRIRVNSNLHTILEAEGVLIDPIGAILAVVALEVVLAQELSVAAQGLIGIPTRLVFGTIAGVVGGFVMAKLLQWERLIPEGLESVTTLSLLLALHAGCEAVLPESGIMAAPVAGVVVGNMPLRPSRELKEFKQQLSVLLIGLLFVLLAADVRLYEVTALGWQGWATVALLMLIVRPLNVAVSTIGSGLNWRERAFLAWLGPRGIVAAAVASVFADHLIDEGVEAGLELRALVFLVIAVTVVVQGLSGNALAGVLRVRRRSDTGFVIAGANPLARALGIALDHAGEDVVLVDTDERQIGAAVRCGLSAVPGDALDEVLLEQLDLQGRRGFAGLIPNEAVTLLIAEKARRDFQLSHAHIAMRPGRAEVGNAQVQRIGARVLFGTPVELEQWSRRITARQVELRVYTYTGTDERALANGFSTTEADEHHRLPLVVNRRGRAALVDTQTRLRNGDTLYCLCDHNTPDPPDFERTELLDACPPDAPQPRVRV